MGCDHKVQRTGKWPGRVDRPWTAFEADPDAEYERVIDIDLGKVDCTVAWPHLPENAHSAREGSDIAIDQIVIGSCTNEIGRASCRERV